MKEPYSEGLATHTGPESCAAVREDRREALTGVRAGWVLNREIRVPPERRLCSAVRKATPATSLSPDAAGLRAVVRPHARTETPAREPGDPTLGPTPGRVRGVNPKGARRR